MNAIRVHEFGPPERMKLESVPHLQPGPGEVKVIVKAAGVNPVDAYIRDGMYRPDLPLPYTPGIDGAGVVEGVGSGVEGFQAGERVYFTWAKSGSYAEEVLCEAANVHRLPEHISFAQGAALGVPYGTAYRALFHRAHAAPGETVFIHGASGGVGLAAVQIGLAAGMRVIGSAGSEEGMRLVKQQGALCTVNHRDPGIVDQVMEFAGQNGVDVILEMLANVNLATDLSLLAHGGRIVVIGCRGRTEFDPREAMSRDAAILGMVLFNTMPREMASIHAALVAGLERGGLNPVVSRELPLAAAAAAHHAVMEGSSLGKIVLIP